MYGYVGRVVSGDSSQHGWESLAVEWFDVNELPQPMIQFAREVLEDARSNRTEPIKRTQLLPFWQNIVVQLRLKLRDLRNWVRRR